MAALPSFFTQADLRTSILLIDAVLQIQAKGQQSKKVLRIPGSGENIHLPQIIHKVTILQVLIKS